MNTNGSRAIISCDDDKEMEISTARIAPYMTHLSWMTAPVIGDVANPQDVHAEHTLEEQTPSADEDQAERCK